MAAAVDEAAVAAVAAAVVAAGLAAGDGDGTPGSSPTPGGTATLPRWLSQVRLARGDDDGEGSVVGGPLVGAGSWVAEVDARSTMTDDDEEWLAPPLVTDASRAPSMFATGASMSVSWLPPPPQPRAGPVARAFSRLLRSVFGEAQDAVADRLESLARKLTRYDGTLRDYAVVLEGERAELQAGLQLARIAAYNELRGVYMRGRYDLLPFFQSRAELVMRRHNAKLYIIEASQRVIQQRVQDTRSLIDVVDQHVAQRAMGNSTLQADAMPVSIEFIQEPDTLIERDTAVQSAKAAHLKISDQIRAADARAHELQASLRLRSHDARKKVLQAVIDRETSRAADAELHFTTRSESVAAHAGSPVVGVQCGVDRRPGAPYGAWSPQNPCLADSSAAVAGFCSVCADQRTREGKLLQAWLLRMLGEEGLTRQMMEMLRFGNDSVDDLVKLRSHAAGLEETGHTKAVKLQSPAAVHAFLKYFVRIVVAGYGLSASAHAPITSMLDRVVYPRIRHVCFATFRHIAESRDAKWAQRQPLARRLTTKQIGVDLKYCAAMASDEAMVASLGPSDAPSAPSPALFVAAAQMLGTISNCCTPSAMLRVLIRTVESALAEAANRSADPYVAGKMDAETLFPIMVFIASRASWHDPFACLALMENFGISMKQRGGMEDYYVTTMAAAVAWICRLKPSDVGVDGATVSNNSGELPAVIEAEEEDSSESDVEGKKTEAAPATNHTPSMSAKHAANLERQENAQLVQQLGKWIGRQQVEDDTMEMLV